MQQLRIDLTRLQADFTRQQHQLADQTQELQLAQARVERLTHCEEQCVVLEVKSRDLEDRLKQSERALEKTELDWQNRFKEALHAMKQRLREHEESGVSVAVERCEQDEKAPAATGQLPEQQRTSSNTLAKTSTSHGSSGGKNKLTVCSGGSAAGSVSSRGSSKDTGAGATATAAAAGETMTRTTET
eukprot:GSA120T00012699001.1